MHRRFLALLGAVTLLIGILPATVGVATVKADSTAIDFNGYSPGTIDGQDGWSSTGPYDREVVAGYPGAPVAFGTQSLRVSNAITSGSFGDQTFSRSLVNEAGEATATNNGLSGGLRQTRFDVQWDIASAVPGAQQPGLMTSFSPDRGDGGRMSYLRVEDLSGGLSVFFDDVQQPGACSPASCANFVETEVATGLARSAVHTLKLSMAFVDGPGNDIVEVHVDGALVHTGTSWEDYYRYDPEASADPNPHTVDSLLIRTGGAAVPATANFGFLIDNLSLTSSTPTPCTATCYVSDSTGSDTNGGASLGDAKKTIQAAIDAVQANGQVRVLPGTYHEAAPGSMPTTIAGGPYQFGLFFGSAKPGIKLIGVTAGNVNITNGAATQATIYTNATNDFGTDGIFVEAANTTIQGVKIGPNDSGDNKTIEVVGDNFTLQYATTAIPGGGGSIYIDDFSSGGTVVQSYHILDNVFPDGTSVDISSGAGNTGPVTGREILRNTFDLVNNGFNGISFNGTGGVPWFANPVGGAVIKANTFSHSSQYIRARGVYDNAQFDWASYWNDNSFDKAAVDLISEPLFDVRPFTYTSDPYTFTNVRRIGGTIQGEIQDGTVSHAVAGDTILVKAGAYPESIAADRSLTIKGAQAGAACGARTFGSPSESAVTGQLTISAANVTFDGFSLTNPGQTIGMLVASVSNNASIKNNILDTIGGAAVDDNVQAIYLQSGPDNVSVTGNCFNNIQGIKTTKAIYSGDSDAASPSVNLTIAGNRITNVTSGTRGGYGIQINNGNGTTANADLTISNNSIDNITGGGWVHAIGLEADTPGAIVTKNIVSTLTSGSADRSAVWFEANPSFASSHVNRNSIAVGASGIGIAAILSLPAGVVDGTCNWWGAASGPGPVGPGTGSLVSANVDFSLWLTSSDLNGACASPGLTLAKSANPTTFTAAGDTITYSYVVKNTGNSSLPGPVTVSDNKATVVCPAVTTVGNLNANLDPGESITCTAIYHITSSDVRAHSVTNNATAKAGSTTSNQATATVAAQKRSLSLTKSANPTTFIAAGDTITYSYVVMNTGNVGLAGPVTVSDNKATVVCPAVTTVGNLNANLDPGESITCTATYHITSSDVWAHSVTNKATAKVSTTTSNQASATVVAQRRSLSLTKSANPTTFKKAGDTISYKYVVKNTGNVGLAGPVAVSDNKATVVCPAVTTVGNHDGTLDPGESITCTATYTITSADLTAHSVTNRATATVATTTSNQATATVKTSNHGGGGH